MKNSLISNIPARAMSTATVSHHHNGSIPEHQRQQSDYMLPTTSPDRANIRDLEVQRNRGRDLFRYNANFRKAIRSNAANAVYTGIQPLFLRRSDRQKLTELNELWRDWVPYSDFQSVLNIYLHQAKAVQALGHTGEIFAVARSGNVGSPIDLSIQMIEADQVPIHLHAVADNGATIRHGIEYDAEGRKVAVWIMPQHPGDFTFFTVLQNLTRFPVEDIIHIMDPDRIGESRGAPNGLSAIAKSRDLQKMQDVTLEHTTQQNALTGFIRPVSGSGGSVNTDFFGDNEGQTSAPIGDSVLRLGTFKVLSGNQDVSFATMADAGRNYKDFTVMGKHEVAAGTDSTYSKTTGDLTQVSFSSMREGGQEFQRGIKQNYQMLLEQQMCFKVNNWFIQGAVFAGVVTATEAAQVAVKNVPPGFPYANPLQGVEADSRAVRAGFKSRNDVAMETGGTDAETIDRENAADQQSATANELVYDSDATRRTRSGGEIDNELAASAVEDDNTRTAT